MNNRLLLVFALSLYSTPLRVVHAEESPSWPLPAALDDTNTTVTFNVDSTWHLVHGVTKEVTGSASQTDPNDPFSVKSLLEIPVNTFDTDSSSRDSRLREAMAAETFPTVRFEGERLVGCTPAELRKVETCRAMYDGKLTIRDVTKSIQIPVELSELHSPEDQKPVKVKGEFSIQWAEYNVEDPSIFVAKLDPTAVIQFEVNLHRAQGH